MKKIKIKELTEISKISRARIKAWIRHGYIKPSKPSGQGLGHADIYTKEDAYAIELLNQLIDSGFKREVAAHAVEIFYYIIQKDLYKPDEIFLLAFMRNSTSDLVRTIIPPADKRMNLKGSVFRAGPLYRVFTISETKQKSFFESFFVEGGKSYEEDLSDIHIVNFKRLKSFIDNNCSIILDE